MRQMLNIRESIKQCETDGLTVSEYSLRLWIKQGKVPYVTAGRSKVLIYYPNLVHFLQCGYAGDSAPATVVSGPGIRRIDAG